MTSVDPVTFDLPTDPLAGFLPPNRNSPEGEGFVTYRVQPLASAVTGTVINAQATVIFDDNKPINTPLIFNTVDALPPTSSVDPLPELSLPSFVVSWAGADDKGGSGIASFDLYVSTDGGDFVPWLLGSTATAGIFRGEAGHTYAFYSVATDNVGNRESIPDGAQATTTTAKAAANFSVFVNAKSVVAGQPFDITVAALDADGNVITDYAGVVHFSSSDVTAGLPNDYPFTPDDAGVHTFKGLVLTRAGTQWVRTVDIGTAVSGYTVVTVVPAPADHFRFIAISHVLSATRFDITLTALDSYGNIDINYVGTVTFTSTDMDPNVVLPLDYQFTSDDAGVHTFTDTGRGETTLITVGDQTIRVTDGTISLDIPITVDQPGSGPGGHPGPGSGRSNGQFVADLFNGVPKTPERTAGLSGETYPVHSPANPLTASPDGTMVAIAGQESSVPKSHARSVHHARNLDDFFQAKLDEPWWQFGWEETRKEVSVRRTAFLTGMV